MTKIPRPLLVLATAGVMRCDLTAARPAAQVTVLVPVPVTVRVPDPVSASVSASVPAPDPVPAPASAPASASAPGPVPDAVPVPTPSPALLRGYDRACVDPGHPALAGSVAGDRGTLPPIVYPRRLPSGAPIVGNHLDKGGWVIDACGTAIGRNV
jgi:hypothetical protein